MSRDNFITHQNIEHYRQLLKTIKDETQRKMILKLLVEEEMAQLQQGAQNEDKLWGLSAITSAKDMTATSVPFRK